MNSDCKQLLCSVMASIHHSHLGSILRAVRLHQTDSLGLQMENRGPGKDVSYESHLPSMPELVPYFVRELTSSRQSGHAHRGPPRGRCRAAVSQHSPSPHPCSAHPRVWSVSPRCILGSTAVPPLLGVPVVGVDPGSAFNDRVQTAGLCLSQQVNYRLSKSEIK